MPLVVLIHEGFPSEVVRDKEKQKIQGSHCVKLLWLKISY
jgi:hypothetical protein